MIYYANDADGINKAVSGLESVIDAKVAADTTLTKGSADSIPDWVIPNKAQLTGGVWAEYRVVTTADVEDALYPALDQNGVWDLELELYPEVKVFGSGALLRASQGMIDFAQDTTYSLAIRQKGLLNLPRGTSDGINSARVLAQRADQFPPANRVLPNMMLLWIDRSTGELITLQQALANAWGSLDANFKKYTRPAVVA